MSNLINFSNRFIRKHKERIDEDLPTLFYFRDCLEKIINENKHKLSDSELSELLKLDVEEKIALVDTVLKKYEILKNSDIVDIENYLM